MAGLQLVYNPLLGTLDASKKTIAEAEIAQNVILEFSCLAGTSVGDPVYQDPTLADRVLSNVDNTQVKLTIGIVISKPTATTCKVKVLGVEDGFTGLGIGDKVWLSETGGLTTTAPTTGYQQTLGIAVSTTKIYFTPNSTRVFKA